MRTLWCSYHDILLAHCKCESAGGREAATGAVFSSSRGTEAASSICTGSSSGGWSSSICEIPMISLKHPDHIIWSCCLCHLQVCTPTFSSTMSEPPLLPHWLGRQKHLWRSLWKHLTEKDTARVIAGEYERDYIFADETGDKQQPKPEKVGFWGRIIRRPWKAFYLLNVNHNTSGSTWTFLEKKTIRSPNDSFSRTGPGAIDRNIWSPRKAFRRQPFTAQNPALLATICFHTPPFSTLSIHSTRRNCPRAAFSKNTYIWLLLVSQFTDSDLTMNVQKQHFMVYWMFAV